MPNNFTRLTVTDIKNKKSNFSDEIAENATDEILKLIEKDMLSLPNFTSLRIYETSFNPNLVSRREPFKLKMLNKIKSNLTALGYSVSFIESVYDTSGNIKTDGYIDVSL